MKVSKHSSSMQSFVGVNVLSEQLLCMQLRAYVYCHRALYTRTPPPSHRFVSVDTAGHPRLSFPWRPAGRG